MLKADLFAEIHILAVDDDAATRQVLCDAFAEAGFAISIAEDGRAAVASAACVRYDLVLVDALTTGIDCFETCQLMRALPGYEHTPIVIIAGIGDTASIGRAFDAGVTDFIVRPINRELLVHRVRYMLRASATLREMGQAEDRIRVLKEAVSCLPIGVGITISDITGKIVYANAKEAEMHGYTSEELMTMRASELGPSSRRKRMRVDDIGKIGLWERECMNVRKNGELFPVKLSSISVTNSEGNCLGIVTACEDITEKRESERMIEQLAFYDTLTKLPNRVTLLDRLRKALSMARRQRRKVAVIFLDLDNFKDINDTLGHDVGDKMLAGVAERLIAETRDFDVVARIGGDEFVVVLNSISEPEDISIAAQRILAGFGHPVEVHGLQLHTNASLGIAIYPNDGQDAETLLKCADAAMYHAKGEGRGIYRFFSEEIDRKIKRSALMKRQLRSSIDRGELHLLYQPQWDLRSGRMTGVEALLRWHNAEFGAVGPAEFIPVAELSGFITEIGAWVLTTACSQVRSWRAAGVGDLKMAVNISGKQLKHPEFLKNVEAVIRDSGIEAGTLEFEFTESVIMENAESHIEILWALKRLGVRLSIDDFGTGYSSLNYLKHFPIDRIKIDRSFVSDVHLSRDDAAIVKAIISMAHSLNLKVVAEGVENRAQMRALIDGNCDEIQGYYLAMPVPAPEVTRLIERANREGRLASRLRNGWRSIPGWSAASPFKQASSPPSP